MNPNHYTRSARALLAGGVVFLTGCATKPENIAPAYVSELSYMNNTCEQLAQEQSRLVEALTKAAEKQREVRSNDTAGVILHGLPVNSPAGGNVAQQIARLKGELQAVQKTAKLKGCDLPPVTDPTTAKKS